MTIDPDVESLMISDLLTCNVGVTTVILVACPPPPCVMVGSNGGWCTVARVDSTCARRRLPITVTCFGASCWPRVDARRRFDCRVSGEY